ncbi:uncharacterized protein B0P05DRAFT_529425 [Gilbertella persicaria]|uniref:uncharacterized protein n=1 Tax=Gilbertella persicaria TaxID=101096 RepID=UPI00221F7740|nr:uncharacterized protein B0P05DRAFT_529425 [Gilbertella persicaria]KAI8090119.1 hypothetical protein B0P05DRAFT_529425 [Gilbertella persicaria]
MPYAYRWLFLSWSSACLQDVLFCLRCQMRRFIKLLFMLFIHSKVLIIRKCYACLLYKMHLNMVSLLPSGYRYFSYNKLLISSLYSYSCFYSCSSSFFSAL